MLEEPQTQKVSGISYRARSRDNHPEISTGWDTAGHVTQN